MRRHNWSTRLSEYVESCRDRRFDNHPFPCVLFAADCVQEITGIDYAAGLRQFESQIGALDLIARHGSIEAAVTAALGIEPSPAAFLARGDVALATAPEQDAYGVTLGICLGPRFAFVNHIGLSMQPRSVVLLGWRIE